jgi:transposase
MLGRNSEQIDIFSHMIYDRLIAKDHLLVKISSVMDFSFGYDKIKDRCSSIGRASKDPAMMFKIFLLEYLYNLSNVQVAKRIRTDVAFRWFLGLNIDDEVPDDTTISHFRIKRMSEDNFESFFNEIVKLCIEKDIIKKRRYIIDTTDVAANANYPSDKKLVCDAFRKVAKELEQFENSIDKEYELSDKVSLKKYLEIASKHIEYLYLKTYGELQANERYQEAFGILYDIVDQYLNNIDKNVCRTCALREQCIRKTPKGKIHGGRRLEVPVRYDAVINDLKRVGTKEFQAAQNNRFKVERRFATMVRNHGLRRARYLNLCGAKIHITLANMASNIVRMVNLLYPPEIAALKS